MAGAEPQLALPLGSAAPYRAADFLPAASNAAARAWLGARDDWPSRRLVLWGPAACGKTHLARCWAGRESVWLDGTPPRELVDLTPYRRIVIDNADMCADDAALLHWLNACAEGGRMLLMTAKSPPSRWPAQLADLTSRLRATQAVSIEPPEDSLLRTLLARLLAERQLSVSAAVQDWLVLSLPRTAAGIREAVGRLDAASLARGQPISRTLGRACLPELMKDGRA